MKNRKIRKALITINVTALCVVVIILFVLFIGPRIIDAAGAGNYDNIHNKEGQNKKGNKNDTQKEVVDSSMVQNKEIVITIEDDDAVYHEKQQMTISKQQATTPEQQGVTSDQQDLISKQQAVTPEHQETSLVSKETYESDKGNDADNEYSEYKSDKCEWCFKRNKGNIPSGTYEPFDIVEYNAYYLNRNVSEDDKVIYLAFDCGYEYGYTPFILDTLKDHNASAMFFVTKSFLETSSDLIIRMKNEGHLVGNHTMNHPSLPEKSTAEIQKEIKALEDYCYEKTGYKPDKFIRPPMGEYSERVLKILQDMDYTTVFWSIAYNDYNVDNQPGKQYVIDHFKEYHHNGAITLTHTVSQSNTEALDEVLSYLEAEGYRFGSLEELK